MNDEIDFEALGRRATACSWWRWLPGMLTLGGWRITIRDAHGVSVATLPDFRDPATLGCLLALVRQAWDRPGITTKRHPVLGWLVIDGADDFLKSVACDSEAEALVFALEPNQ